MTRTGWRGLTALAAVILCAGGSQAPRACSNGMLAVVGVRDGQTRIDLPAQAFTLKWRHSVSLTPVEADYIITPDGGIVQTEERFIAHGPGMAYDGKGWVQRDGAMVLPLDRPVPRLILRSAPEHENRLIVGDQMIDLTRWPATPLEILSPDCKED
ncbi:DUF1850 domain-containing protein [Roseovarius sp. 217]|uniref:DUF1850 domain-containing protein n=1 Tax=Roseovarius sp. (strain 217) TaxID=314264 RepID=UPI0012EDE023|nr:DUF1850 domain-containing protein [Roseovarius sp. 217]